MDALNLDRRDCFKLLAGLGLGLAGSAVPAVAAPLTLDQIKKNGSVRIGCEAAYRPFTFRDQGKIVGYDVDLAEIIYKPLGVKCDFIDTAWSGIVPALYAGNFDVIHCAMTYTKERVGRVAFSIPYAEATQEMLIRAADAGKVKAVEDMSGKILGVKLGSAGDTMKTALDQRVAAKAGKGFSEVKTYDDHPAAYLALAQGSVDGVINTLATLTQVLKDAPGRYAIIRNVGPMTWSGIATRKDEKDLIGFVDQRLAQLKAGGELYALQEKWFGTRMQLAEAIPSFS
ncbi:transporter substrate-binding domain-containing protein [Methylobacterium terricola]|nr:transporter substrate-binding domain-containing protein [Methylobacterium terricola]